MKKYILSPLCSALVIPGLGQILNHNLGKGLTLMAVVFLLFVGGTVKLVFIIKSLVNQPALVPRDPVSFLMILKGQNYTSLLYLTIAFGLVWIYSIVDAYLVGLKLEGKGEDAKP
jgi:TM2 domain-containing membrane protein YozV